MGRSITVLHEMSVINYVMSVWLQFQEANETRNIWNFTRYRHGGERGGVHHFNWIHLANDPIGIRATDEEIEQKVYENSAHANWMKSVLVTHSSIVHLEDGPSMFRFVSHADVLEFGIHSGVNDCGLQ